MLVLLATEHSCDLFTLETCRGIGVRYVLVLLAIEHSGDLLRLEICRGIGGAHLGGEGMPPRGVYELRCDVNNIGLDVNYFNLILVVT